MGELVFRKIQYGKENPAARGTPVAATGMFPGAITVPTDRKPTYPEERSGTRARSVRSVVHQIMADGMQLSMDECVFQKLPMLFSMGLKGAITAAEQTTAQHDYLWDFTPSLLAANNPDSLTLEFGDNVQAYEVEYCLARSYSISGRIGGGEAVKIQADVFGKQVTPTAFTGSLSLATFNGVSANMVKLYIDPTWAALGSTQKTNLLREFTLDITTGLHPKFLGNGVKTFSSHGESYIDAMLTLVLEGNADADALFDVFQLGTPKAIRLEILGEQIGTGDPHSLIVDLYGSFEEVVPLAGEIDGNNTHAAVFHAFSDNLAVPHLLGLSVTTNVSAL